MNILLVDDEFFLLKALKETVEEVVPKAECFDFSDAEEAMEFSENTSIDIAFLDINMGGLDGVTMAKQLQERYPRINIIFCTAFQEYMQDALDLFCSAYLLKPVTPEKVFRAMENLRYPVEERQEAKVFFHCFGNFEAYYEGQPIRFKYTRTKELLAYLVDRDGASCSTREIQGVLFEDEVHPSYFNQIRKDLLTTFENLGEDDVISRSKGFLGINKQAVSCDYFDYLEQKSEWMPKEYMLQYSFAETSFPLIRK